MHEIKTGLCLAGLLAACASANEVPPSAAGGASPMAAPGNASSMPASSSTQPSPETSSDNSGGSPEPGSTPSPEAEGGSVSSGGAAVGAGGTGGEANGGGSGEPQLGHPLGGERQLSATRLSEIAGGGFTEGPSWLAESPWLGGSGFVFTSSNDLKSVTLAGRIDTLLPAIGPKGTAAASDGRLFVAAGDSVRIYSREGAQQAMLQGGFASANDLVVTDDGHLYFTNFQSSPGLWHSPADGSPEGIDGAANNSNGIALSPDQQTLYVVVSGGSPGIVQAWELVDGVPKNPTELAEASGIWADGMAVDRAGNLFVTSSVDNQDGRVDVFSAEGESLGMIEVGVKVTNCAFGGPELRTLLITADGELYSVELANPGLP